MNATVKIQFIEYSNGVSDLCSSSVQKHKSGCSHFKKIITNPHGGHVGGVHKNILALPYYSEVPVCVLDKKTPHLFARHDTIVDN